jgi:hypothetical protein
MRNCFGLCSISSYGIASIYSRACTELLEFWRLGHLPKRQLITERVVGMGSLLDIAGYSSNPARGKHQSAAATRSVSAHLTAALAIFALREAIGVGDNA